MQWCVEVPFSSSSFSTSSISIYSFPNRKNNLLSSSSFLLTMAFLFNLIYLPSSVQTSSSLSVCSPYFQRSNIDFRTKNEYIEPCPVKKPCQCICEIESKRLWIDCFYRQLESFPTLRTIQTNQTVIEWNIDLAFNLFDNLTFINNKKKGTSWIPDNMHIRHMVLSSSLAYDLIVQLNLTHRHLIDNWPSQYHLPIIDDQYQLFDEYDDDTIKHTTPTSTIEYKRLLTDLTKQFREKTKRIQSFSLTLSGEPSPISNLYLNHNSLQTIPLDALYNATGLYEIYLSFNNITQLPAYAFGFSHRLTRVDLSHNQISSVDNLTFQRHPDAFAGPFLIDYLDLSHNQISILENNAFAYLVNLRLLKLEHNQIYSISAHVWTGLYRLKYLDLSHNFIENLTQSFYSGYLNELTHLKLTSNTLSQLDQCEFLSLKSLTKLNLNGNNLSTIDICSFYGLRQSNKNHLLNLYLRSNQLETMHPCTFINFGRSTIHLENNPLLCNCSLNYLSHYRQSLAYTGQECRRGFNYQTSNQQLTLPAVRKTNLTKNRNQLNVSATCRDSYRFYDDLCLKFDCANQCAPNERLIIQVTTIATPSRTNRIYQHTTKISIFFLILIQSNHFSLFLLV